MSINLELILSQNIPGVDSGAHTVPLLGTIAAGLEARQLSQAARITVVSKSNEAMVRM